MDNWTSPTSFMEVVDGPQEWIGSRISFDLKRDGEYAVVFFKHEGWKEPTECLCLNHLPDFVLVLVILLMLDQ